MLKEELLLKVQKPVRYSLILRVKATTWVSNSIHHPIVVVAVLIMLQSFMQHMELQSMPQILTLLMSQFGMQMM